MACGIGHQAGLVKSLKKVEKTEGSENRIEEENESKVKRSKLFFSFKEKDQKDPY